MSTKTTTSNNLNESKKNTKDFYVQLYFNYVTGDETVVLISRTLGINGVSFWIWLNAVMSKYDGLFVPRDLDILLYSKQDKDTALSYIQKFKELNVLWETPEGKFTTEFLRDTYLQRIRDSKYKSLTGGLKGLNLSGAEKEKKLEEFNKEADKYLEEIKGLYDRKYPVTASACYMDRMYDNTEEDVIEPEINNFISEVEQPAPVAILPEDYSIFDDETPTEVAFDEEPVDTAVINTGFQMPSIPNDVQEKIDEVQKESPITESVDKSKILLSWGLTQGQVESLIANTTPETLDAYIAMTEAEARNKGAFISKAVRERWNVSKYLNKIAEAAPTDSVQTAPQSQTQAPATTQTTYKVGENDFADKTEVDEFYAMMKGFGFAESEIKPLVEHYTYNKARDYAYYTFTKCYNADKKSFYYNAIRTGIEVEHWDRRPIQVSTSSATYTVVNESQVCYPRWEKAVKAIFNIIGFSDRSYYSLNDGWSSFVKERGPENAALWAERVLVAVQDAKEELLDKYKDDSKQLFNQIQSCLINPSMSDKLLGDIIKLKGNAIEEAAENGNLFAQVMINK